MKYLITIIGPTAIGKTALSIELAQHFNCEIISCDSRQFFKEMHIGTAVPDAGELSTAKHHFIQNKSIFEAYTVGDFEKEALVRIDELFLTNDFLILVGGSGLYVDAILKGFDDFPAIDPAVRQHVAAQYQQHGIDYLQDQLRQLDFVYFEKLQLENPQTLQNPQRLMRFLEVCVGTGKPYSTFLNQTENRRNFAPIVIGLQTERSLMYERINQRVDKMMADGLEVEARRLFDFRELNALKTVGYKELFASFNNKLSLQDAVDEIKKNTRRFAKRQLTWFKKKENVRWFDLQHDKKHEILSYINSTVNQH